MDHLRVLLFFAVVLCCWLLVASDISQLPCPTACVLPDYYFQQNYDLDLSSDPDSISSLLNCAQNCFLLGHPYYDFQAGSNCHCFTTCNNDPNNSGGFQYYTPSSYGYAPACFINLNITCSPAGQGPVAVHGIPGTKYKCCFSNTNSTFPIVNYPFTGTNFSPLLTDTRVSSKGTALGIAGPGSTFCFNFINPTSLGTPTFGSAAQPLTLASLSFSSPAGSGLLLDCNSIPSFSAYGVIVLAKFSCILVNTLPRTVRNVVFSCTNFIPLFTSGLNRDCTLSKSVAPYSKATFVFQVIPAAVSITLKSYN